MALIAYLMEHKNNCGPHLIIVPNAVIVNWKSELLQWLPTVRCVYYVGHKDDRARLFNTEVQSMQFNVLVTTYEFIMRDRTKLSKVDWRYIIIDEAQVWGRMWGKCGENTWGEQGQVDWQYDIACCTTPKCCCGS